MAAISQSRAPRQSQSSYDRKLKYKEILEDLQLEEDNNNNVERIDKTSAAVQAARTLLADGGVEEKVKHPGEGYLDSRVLRATSDLAVRCSEAVSGNANVYDKQELALYIKHNPEFCNILLPCEAPVYRYMFGASHAAPPPRPRKERVKVQPQRAKELLAPKTVDKLERTTEGAEMVSRVHRFLSRQYKAMEAPLSYFHVVLHPTSFSITIENIYNVSFLVKDNKVKIDIEESSGLPFITPLSSKEQARTEQAKENQFIVSMDMQRWQDLVDAFKIETPMMKLK